MQKSPNQKDAIMRKTWLVIAGFERGRESWAKECLQLLEAEKGKEMDSSLELPEGRQLTLILAQWDPFWISNL